MCLIFCSISAILNSRFLLALYETNAHLDRGGSAASPSSTLNFGGADREASSELPDFLSSLASPIQSINDNKPELFGPEATPRRLVVAKGEAIDGTVGAKVTETGKSEIGEQV